MTCQPSRTDVAFPAPQTLNGGPTINLIPRFDVTTVQTISLAADELNGGEERVVLRVTLAPDDRPALLVMTRGLAEVLGRRLTGRKPAH